MAPGDECTRQVGAATIPLAGVGGGLSVSYPLAILETDGTQLKVRLRFSALEAYFLLALRLRGQRPASGTIEWSATWDSIESVLVAKRSFVVKSARAEPCRFVTPSQADAQRLVSILEMHGVVAEPVRSTISYAWPRRPPPG
jgi:hypothetical protein